MTMRLIIYLTLMSLVLVIATGKKGHHYRPFRRNHTTSIKKNLRQDNIRKRFEFPPLMNGRPSSEVISDLMATRPSGDGISSIVNQQNIQQTTATDQETTPINDNDNAITNEGFYVPSSTQQQIQKPKTLHDKTELVGQRRTPEQPLTQLNLPEEQTVSSQQPVYGQPPSLQFSVDNLPRLSDSQPTATTIEGNQDSFTTHEKPPPMYFNPAEHQTNEDGLKLTDGDEIDKEQIKQVLKSNSRQKILDESVHKALNVLNEHENREAVNDVLHDESELKAAQRIADDRPFDESNEVGSKKHLLVHTHHPHHYMIDPLPVHYHHHHHHHGLGYGADVGYAVLSDPRQSLLGEGYSVLPGHGGGAVAAEGYAVADHGHGYATLTGEEEELGGAIGPFQSTLQNVHVPHGFHRHSFDEEFPVEEDHSLEYGPLVGQGEDSDEALTHLANRLDYAHELPHHGVIHHRPSFRDMHFGANGLAEEYGEGLLTPVDHDDPITGIVSDMTHGHDLTNVHGHDNVHIEGNDYGHRYSGWANHPYVYGHTNRAWGDGVLGTGFGHYYHRHHYPHFFRHGNHHFEPATHFYGHANEFGEDIHPNFNFHYPTYEVPLHGAIVSEKEAQKIGLYDDSYLKKLGIWEETKGNGRGIEGNNWIGGGMLDKLAWQRQLQNHTNTTITIIHPFSSNLTGSQTGGGGGSGGGGGAGGSGGGCQVPADVGFLFDGSKLGEEKQEYFKKYIEFAKQIVQVHPPSTDGYHYGAVVYTDSGELQFDFEKSYTQEGVIAEFERIKVNYPQTKEHDTEMGDGLKVVKEQLFDRTARDWVYQVLVVITDSHGTGEVEKWAQALRDSTVNIFVIGLDYKESKADDDQINKVGTDPDQHHVFHVDINDLLGTTRKVDHPQHLAQVIPNQICRMDLIFIIDLKEDNGERLTGIKNFIKDSTAELGLGQFGSHVGLVGYGGKGSKDGWDLLSKTDRNLFTSAVDRLEDEAGKVSDSGKAMEIALKYFLEEKNEPRIGQFWRYINMTILVTDRPLDGNFKEYSKKLRDHGVIFHSVGWNKADEEAGKLSLADASSDTDDFYVHTHKEISKLQQVSKRMRQYFAHLMMGRQGETTKVEGGWEGNYGESSSSSSSASWSSSSSSSSFSSSSSRYDNSDSRSEVNKDDVDMKDTYVQNMTLPLKSAKKNASEKVNTTSENHTNTIANNTSFTKHSLNDSYNTTQTRGFINDNFNVELHLSDSKARKNSTANTRSRTPSVPENSFRRGRINKEKRTSRKILKKAGKLVAERD